jgi:hypothetical protein
MKKILCLVAALAAIPISATSRAEILASATISAVADGPNFDYTIHLTNLAASTDSVETFWYSWVPGADFLPTNPFDIVSPAGWTAAITHFPDIPTNGYAIQWKTLDSPSAFDLAPGNSLDFMFSSADTPAQLAGISPFYPGVPVGRSVLYEGQPFTGSSLTFEVRSVPEPSSWVMGLLGGLGCLAGRRGWRKRGT